MDLIVGSKRINGLCWQGKSYALDPLNPIGVKCIENINTIVSAEPDWGAEQTKGYKVSFSVTSTAKFDMRSVDNPKQRLDYIPEHTFVLLWGDKTILDTLTLVYDGDYMFHIEGSISFTGYHSSKTLLASLTVYGVYVVDKNGNFFLTTATTLPIKATVGTSQTTINYTNPTLTFERRDVEWEEVEQEIVLPYKVSNIVPEDVFTETPSLNIVGSTAPSLTVSYSQRFL